MMIRHASLRCKAATRRMQPNGADTGGRTTARQRGCLTGKGGHATQGGQPHLPSRLGAGKPWEPVGSANESWHVWSSDSLLLNGLQLPCSVLTDTPRGQTEAEKNKAKEPALTEPASCHHASRLAGRICMTITGTALTHACEPGRCICNSNSNSNSNSNAACMRDSLLRRRLSAPCCCRGCSSEIACISLEGAGDVEGQLALLR
ncbi:hypothetical protein K431DRAFT_64244 [Polychaeton citri CBS 116435]|uniref:Uncharacterized protein n=1 Tax=Polychaeton citri CBS 116435 TaxID=1314669 RepID=A0A9P4Q726_9PEZI|nr:hypothetical protein K431DRAFT_64244 [Polychaeton citri CBS 116435]